MQANPIDQSQWEAAQLTVKTAFPMNQEDRSYLCFKGETSNTMYKTTEESIKILLKSGEIANISAIQNALINESLSAPVKKFYICTLSA